MGLNIVEVVNNYLVGKFINIYKYTVVFKIDDSKTHIIYDIHKMEPYAAIKSVTEGLERAEIVSFDGYYMDYEGHNFKLKVKLADGTIREMYCDPLECDLNIVD